MQGERAAYIWVGVGNEEGHGETTRKREAVRIWGAWRIQTMCLDFREIEIVFKNDGVVLFLWGALW
jgi:hypothetical protein